MPDSLNYLLLMLIWAAPLIVLQWLLGLDVLLKRWKVWIVGILLSTLYLIIADAFGNRARTLNPTQTLGIAIINVPLENAVYFLVTNTLIVQSLIFIMYSSLMIKRVRRLFRLIRRGPGAGE